MMTEHFLAARDRQLGDVAAGKAETALQQKDGGDRHMRRNVARITLEHDARRLPHLAQVRREVAFVAIAAKDIEIAELAFEYGCRPSKTVAGQHCRHHAGLRTVSE